MRNAFIALVIIFFVNVLGLYYGWYHDFFWFDMTLHFFGGFFMAMLMANYLDEYFVNKNLIKNVLIIVGTTTLIGVVWEFSEYTANIVISPMIYKWFAVKTYFMGDLDDTVSDLLMDVFGSLAFSLLHSLRRRKTHQI
jgi:uncharacterized membrane protein YjdF